MFIKKNLSIIVLGAVVFGFVWPNPGLLLKDYLVYLLMVMMFFSCLKIDFKELKKIPQNWWRFLIILSLIFIFPASIVFIFKHWLEDIIFVGLIIAAAMPAGISIVFLSDLMGGEPAKALVITAISHIISPVITPLIVWLFAHKIVNIELGEMVILISRLVIIPLVLAQIVRKFKKYERVAKIGSNVNLILLFILVWSSIALARIPILTNLSQFIISAIIILIILVIGILFSVWFGRDREEDITWAVSSIYKNFTLASVVALTMFGPMAMVGAAVYDVLDNLLLVPIKWWVFKNNLKK